MKLPKVSILVPAFNSENFIMESIQSAINQTWPNKEIIIVNDGSTDNTECIINSIKCQIVKAFTQENKGACSARNLAFRESSGSYIQYLDADDILSATKIEEQMKLIIQNGDNTISSCKWGRFSSDKKWVKWEEQFIDKDYIHPVDWLRDSWMGNGMAQTATWLTPRQLIEKAGSWDEDLKINQDGDFFCRVLLHAQSIKFSPKAGVYYRSGHPQTITQTSPQSRNKAESLLKSYNSYECILSSYDTPEIRKALGNNYLIYMYQFYSLYPDLSSYAEKSFKELGLTKMWHVGGENFKKLAKIVGFKNALKIKKHLDKSI